MILSSNRVLVCALALVFVVCIGLLGKIIKLQKQNSLIKEELTRLELKHSYLRDAAKINDYYARFDVSTRISVIHDVLVEVDSNIKRYFPNGPFTSRDLITIAMVESSFNQYLTGRDGEFGIFQILPASSSWAKVKKNQFDIDVNTDLAFFVLNKKYQKYKEYKMSIIAYNGVVKRGGKISEIYWKKFIKYRRALDDILARSSVFEK